MQAGGRLRRQHRPLRPVEEARPLGRRRPADRQRRRTRVWVEDRARPSVAAARAALAEERRGRAWWGEWQRVIAAERWVVSSGLAMGSECVPLRIRKPSPRHSSQAGVRIVACAPYRIPSLAGNFAATKEVPRCRARKEESSRPVRSATSASERLMTKSREGAAASAMATASSRTSTCDAAPHPTGRRSSRCTRGSEAAQPATALCARASMWRRKRCEGASSARTRRATVACAKRRCAMIRKASDARPGPAGAGGGSWTAVRARSGIPSPAARRSRSSMAARQAACAAADEG